MKKEIITGFFDIEDVLNENEGSGKLIAIVSRPGMGKSTFALNLLSNMAALNEGNVLLFSLENDKKSVIEKLKRNEYIVDEDLKKIYIDDTNGIDIGYIEKSICAYDNLEAVFIDCIQLVESFKYSCEREKFLLKLKKICNDKNLHIIYTSVLSRPLNSRLNDFPALIDIDTDSAKISDAIFALYRKSYVLYEDDDVAYKKTVPNSAELFLIKNNFGELKKSLLQFDASQLRYSHDYDGFDAVLENRNELHLHTKLSDDVSVIGVDEIFEKAQKLGLKTMAFTNLNNIQDFPAIMRCAKKHEDIKAIYGAQVRYKSGVDGSVYHLTLLAKNQAGIKELYKVISSIDGENLIDMQVLKNNRKNLLVGSCGSKGELFDLIDQDKVPYAINTFYDYFEIFPSKDIFECEMNKKIFRLGEELGVSVVAVSNGHYIEKQDKICCDIVRLAQKKGNVQIDEYYIRNTKEMLEEFSYLGDYGAERVVLENAQIIADNIEKTEPLKTGNYYPVFENAYNDLRRLCYQRAYEIYGDPLPKKVKERLETELGILNDEQFATQYLLARKLTTFAKENGQLTTVRGAGGSTLVAFLLGISEVNPLPAHYCCDCHYFEISDLADDGFDLPEKLCPVCQKKLKTDGHNIPYEVFMGVNGDKIPDIDLNFPEGFMSEIQRFMGECFGSDKVVQAGTVATVWDKIAEIYIQEYESTKNVNFKPEEKQKFISKIAGIKKDVGMHPGGVMVIPQDMEFEDFTPLNKNFAPRRTTHFDFHSLYDTILKQDVLANCTLNLLLELEKQTDISIDSIDYNDPKVYDAFNRGDTKNIPEFDHDFVRNVIAKTNPKNFNDLVKISSLSHGTNIWSENVEELIQNGVCNISDVAASRDDILNCLMQKGMEKSMAFRIMESVRKGRWANSKLLERDKKQMIESMLDCGVPEWYIESLSKIRYMFTKAHSVAYVMNAVRVAWFKIYYPNDFKNAYEIVYGEEKIF